MSTWRANWGEKLPSSIPIKEASSEGEHCPYICLEAFPKSSSIVESGRLCPPKRVDHPENGTISQQLWDNIIDLIQQKSRYQLAAGGANRKTRMWRIPSAVSSTSCFLQRWDHQEAGSDVLLMGSSRLNFSEVDRMVKWGLCIIWWGKNCSCRAYYL